MLEFLREKNLEKFLEEFSNKDFIEILEGTLEFNCYRSYFKIDQMGKINSKRPNMPLIKLALLGKDYLNEYFTEGLNITEKRKIRKIDRLSSFTVENLEKNLYKVFYNRDLSIGLRYCKEFILKDKELFIKKISHFILLDEIKNEKSLLTLTFIKSLGNVNKKNIDSVLYSFLPYLITYPSHITSNKKDFIINFDIEKQDLYSLAYLNLIKYGYTEYEKDYIVRVSEYLESRKSSIEDKILFERLSVEKNELYEMWNRIKESNL